MSHIPIDDMPHWAERIEGKLDTLNSFLTGGSEPARGLIVRVDRLEQSEQRKGFWVTTAIGAAVTAVIGAVWSLVAKHPQ